MKYVLNHSIFVVFLLSGTLILAQENTTPTVELHTEAEEKEPDFSPKPVNPAVIQRLPQFHGERSGTVYIAQRTVIDRFRGWGWIKKENEPWEKAKWTMIKEIPGRYMVPHRFLGDEEADTGIRYKFYGRFADYQGYESNYDLFTKVFILRGWELIGVGDNIGKHLPGKVIIRKNRSTPYTRRKPAFLRQTDE